MSNTLNDVSNLSRYTTKSIEEMMALVTSMLKASATNDSANKMKEILDGVDKGAVPKFFMVEDIARNDLYNLFKDNGLNIPIYNIDGSDYSLAIIKKDEELKVQTLINQYMSAKGRLHEVPIDTLKDMNFEKSIKEIKNLDKYQASKLKEYLDRTSITYSFVQNKSNNYSVFVSNNKNAKVLQQCLSKTMWDLSGDRGVLERKAIDFKETMNQAIEKARKEGKDYWIVSADFSHEKSITKLHVSSRGYEIYDNDELRDSGSAKSKDYESNLYRVQKSFANPIMVSATEMPSSNVELLKIVKKKNQKGKIDYKLKEIAKKEAELKQLLEQKLLMKSSHEQREVLSSLQNNEVSFREFLELDKVNEEHGIEEFEKLKKYDDIADMKTELLDRLGDIVEEIETFEITEEFVDSLSIEGLIDSKEKELQIEKEQTITERSTPSRQGLPSRSI